VRHGGGVLIWRVGPLRFELDGVAPPAGFGGDGAADFVVDVEARELVDVEERRLDDGGLAPIDPIVCHVDGERIRYRRSGGFEADVDMRRDGVGGHASYRGLVDVSAGGQTAVLESFLRAVTASSLLRSGGALLHGASVAVAGRGYGFCGLSGAGKTTLVDGTDDDTFLADDQTLLSITGQRLTVWGSPFAGLSARRAKPIAVPLRAVVLLASTRPSSTRLVRRHDKARVAGELLRHVCCFEATPAEGARALAFAAGVVERVPMFALERHLSTSVHDVVGLIERDLSGAAREAA
jgi:hypothetical protein